MKYMIYQPSLTGNEKKYVNECLDSTWISSKGRFVEEFPKRFAEYIGVRNATGVCNGTVAIQLALAALGLGPGDEVIVPTFTYIASANPILQTGAKVVFCDSLADTWQMDPKDIEERITPNTKAIMAVHIYGHPCDMDAIMTIAKKHKLLVVEDCAEAIGSKYKGKMCGSFGDVACFSFFGNKTITCGEGGIVATNSDSLFDLLVHIKCQGLAKDREYWHDIIGFNYRMTNIQAAIGLAQLEQIDKFVAAKQDVAKWYQKYLVDLPVKFHEQVGDVRHTFWMNSILASSNDERNRLREHLKAAGVETRPTFFPVHTMPPYFGKYKGFPTAEDIALRGMNLPSYPMLKEDDVKYICNAIREFYSA